MTTHFKPSINDFNIRITSLCDNTYAKFVQIHRSNSSPETKNRQLIIIAETVRDISRDAPLQARYLIAKMEVYNKLYINIDRKLVDSINHFEY
jgi:hypothetical protein